MIPAHLYTPIHYNTLLIVVLITAVVVQRGKQETLRFCRFFGWLFLVCLILYMGLRPISWVFGDMRTYKAGYKLMQEAGKLPTFGEGDWFFALYMFISGLFIEAKAWFLLTAGLYCGLAALAFRIVHKRSAYLAFLMCAASMSFWSYGTNGLRNGLATSLVLLGFACWEKRAVMVSLFLVAISTHMSTVLPVAAFVFTLFYNKPRTYLMGYGAAVTLSLIMGGWWTHFFANMDLFGDDRLAVYFSSEEYADLFRYTGFRYDFLLYSLWPIVLGAYYIFKRNYRDQFYLRLFNTYVAANAFWVLVIRASFSNRFAYLSWFMMSWVIVYPLLKQQLFKKQDAFIAANLILYYGFSYALFLVGL